MKKQKRSKKKSKSAMRRKWNTHLVEDVLLTVLIIIFLVMAAVALHNHARQRDLDRQLRQFPADKVIIDN